MIKIIFTGNLTADPQSRTSQTGENICNFSVAANNKKNEAQFYRVAAFGKMGENCQKYLAKGRKVLIVGEPKTEEYTGRDGEKHYSNTVYAAEVEFLGGKHDTAGDSVTKTPDSLDGYVEVTDEQLPF